MIDFVHRALGYSATGDTSEQVLFINYGGGANGKGTHQTMDREALGPYAYNAPFSTIEMKGRQSQTFDLADLAGRRFVTASETNESARLNEARVKALTGEDPITARHAYANFETYAPVLKLWLSVNHLPQVDDDSFAFWRRVRLMPFTKRFEGKSCDPALKDKLRAELPGILAWIVRGCLEWQARGLAPPPQVQAATERYREDSDMLSAFIADRCLVRPDVSVVASALYREYQDWAKAEGIKDREQLSAAAFGTRVGQRFERRHSKRGRIYFGIALADNAQQTFAGGNGPKNEQSSEGDDAEGEGSVVSEVKGLGASRKLFSESPHGENFPKQGSNPSPLHPEDSCQYCGQVVDYYDPAGNAWCALHGPGKETDP